jgi:hypothetical protein
MCSFRLLVKPWQRLSIVIFRLFRSRSGNKRPGSAWDKYCDISTFPMPKTTNSATKVESPWQRLCLSSGNIGPRHGTTALYCICTVIFRLFLCQKQLIPLEKKAFGSSFWWPCLSSAGKPCFDVVCDSRHVSGPNWRKTEMVPTRKSPASHP